MIANIYKTSIILLAMLALTQTGVSAQTTTAQTEDSQNVPEAEPKTKKAWEFGVGANGLHMSRLNICGFQKEASGYAIDISKKDLIFGGQLYVARELTPHLYLDLQGNFDFANDRVMDGKEFHWIAMAGLGLQWRLGEYFGSHYIDPFLRVGANYMYKNFKLIYNGVAQVGGEDLSWEYANNYNKNGADRQHLFPISLGAGVNMWLNDRVGIGLQTDYLLMPHKDVSNVWMSAARVMIRFGGKSKKPEPQYIERLVEVERIVEKPTYIEKVVEVPIYVHDEIYELFENVYFVFDKSDITDESQEIIDRIAKIMKNNSDKKYLITGSTDVRGSDEYNQKLSERRAKAVVDALVDRGVDASILKWRGVGKHIANAPYEQSDAVRKGDRKILVEVVSNDDYWDFLN